MCLWMIYVDFKDKKSELLVPAEIKEWHHHVTSFFKKIQL